MRLSPPSWVVALTMIALPFGVVAQPVDVPGTSGLTFYSLAASGDTLFAGANGRLFVSNDRGETWTATQKVHAEAISIDAIIATDAGWFASSFKRGVFRSTDRGMSWTEVNQGLAGIGSLYVSDFERDGSSLFGSTDGAGVFVLDLAAPTAWQKFGNEFAENEAETVPELALDGQLLVAAAGGNGLILTRDLGGSEWIPVQLVGHIVAAARTGLGLMVASSRRAFYRNAQSGQWEQTGEIGANGFDAAIASTTEDGVDGVAFLSITQDEGLSLLFRSYDLASPWEFVQSTGENLSMLLHGGRLYLGQADGLRYLPLEPSSGIRDADYVGGLVVDIPYPHPVAGPSKISIHVDRRENVHVDVIDATGRRVAVLHDGPVGPGAHTICVDGAALARGLYLVRAISSSRVAIRPFVVG